MDPRKLKKWLILIGLLYLVFPRDLILDFLGGGLGLLDDLSVMALLTWIYRKRLREHTAQQTRDGVGPAGAFDPFQTLGIPASASGEAIEAAYRSRMKEYHPDKVAHLGPDLQQLAHRKTLEIQRAYQQLRR